MTRCSVRRRREAPPGKARVRRVDSVLHRRRAQDTELRRQIVGEMLDDDRIAAERQMGPVLLGRAHRHDERRALLQPLARPRPGSSPSFARGGRLESSRVVVGAWWCSRPSVRRRSGCAAPPWLWVVAVGGAAGAPARAGRWTGGAGGRSPSRSRAGRGARRRPVAADRHRAPLARAAGAPCDCRLRASRRRSARGVSSRRAAGRGRRRGSAATTGKPRFRPARATGARQRPRDERGDPRRRRAAMGLGGPPPAAAGGAGRLDRLAGDWILRRARGQAPHRRRPGRGGGRARSGRIRPCPTAAAASPSCSAPAPKSASTVYPPSTAPDSAGRLRLRGAHHRRAAAALQRAARSRRSRARPRSWPRAWQPGGHLAGARSSSRSA